MSRTGHVSRVATSRSVSVRRGGGPAPALPGHADRAVRVDVADGPRVAVGDVEIGVVAAGGDPVTDTDPLTEPGGHGAGVVDGTDVNERVTDRGVQGGDLLARVPDQQLP